MSDLADALRWNGTHVILSLFVMPGTDVAEPDVQRPVLVKGYSLEPPAGSGVRAVREYDLYYDAVPADLETVVTAWLRAASAPDRLAWFGYEGSFDFTHLLTPDVADQVYALAEGSQVHLALDDATRESQGWADLVARAGRSVH